MKTYNIVNGTKYEQNGEEKMNWQKVGTLFKNDKGGYSIKMDSIPVGEWNGSLICFENKPKEENSSRREEERNYGY